MALKFLTGGGNMRRGLAFGSSSIGTYAILLQASTPGTAQTGNGNITGRMIAGTFEGTLGILDSISTLEIYAQNDFDGIYLRTASTAEVARLDTTNKRLNISEIDIPSNDPLYEQLKLLVINKSSTASNLRGIADLSAQDNDFGARVNLMKCRGTAAAPAIVQVNDLIGRLIWKGYDGAAWLDTGCIRLEVSAGSTVALNRIATDMVFYTSSNTAPSVYRETLRLTESGNLIMLDQKYFQTSIIKAVTSSDSAIQFLNYNNEPKFVLRFHPSSGYNNADFYCGSVNNSGGFISGTVFQVRSDTLGSVSCRVANDSTPQILYFDAKQFSFTAGATDGTKTTAFTILQTGVAIGTNATPTARLHLPAGDTAASSAPLKMTSGSLLTAPEAGALEFLTDGLYFTTTTGATRKRVQLQAAIVKTTGSPLTLDESFTTVVINSASAYTVNLPAATGSFKIYDIKNINTGLVTVDGNGAETIDGALTQAVAQWDNLRIQDYASGTWIIL